MGASIRNSTDTDPELASLLGRFSQSFCDLESAVEAALTRLLPLTDPMGSILFAQNAISRNLTILEALMSLPEVSISDDQRSHIRQLIREARELSGDRNRLLHGRIIESGHPSSKYFLVQHQSDERGDRSSAMPLDLEYYSKKLDRLKEVSAAMMFVPRVEYDLKSWTLAHRQYPTKPAPTAKTQAPPRPKDRS